MDPNLYLAATKGDLNVLRTFQETSNLQSQLTPSQETVLHVATEFYQVEFAVATVQYCWPLLWQVNSSGDTALHIAAREKREYLVMHFIDYARKADETTGESRHLKELVGRVNLKNDTALHCAARSGATESVKLLVEADPEVCGFVNNDDESPLYLCVASNFYGKVQHIINCAPRSASYKGPRGLTALHSIVFIYAYAREEIEEIEVLVRWRREMIREGDELGMTPLHYAAFYGRIEAIKLFLQYDSSAIYLLNNTGESALHIAAFRGHVDALEELINCRPDCYNLVNNKGRTALHAAVLGYRPDAVQFLLKTPTLERLINKQDKDGNTALHLAAIHQFYAAIEIITNNTKVPLLIVNNEFLTYHEVSRIQKKKKEKRPRETADPYYSRVGKGIMRRQQFAKAELEEMNKEADQDAIEKTPTNDDNHHEKSDDSSNSDRKRVEQMNLVVATLVATVTFTAGITVPGGFISKGEEEGLAILTKKAAFKVFIVFNTLAFCCSIFAMLLHFLFSLGAFKYRELHRASIKIPHQIIGIVSLAITAAILWMILAFSSGTYVVLTKSIGLSLTPYIICGCLVVVCVIPFAVYVIYLVQYEEP